MLEDQAANTDAFLVPHDMRHMISALDCVGACADSKSDAYDVLDVKIVPDVCEEEWSHCLASCGLVTLSERRKVGNGHLMLFSNMELRILVRRQAFFFVVKVACVIWVLMIMAPIVFRFPRDDISDRMTVSLTLTLTAIAFQYAVNAHLPILPYLTSLDYLVNVMYFLYAFAYFENYAVYEIDKWDDAFAAQIDSWSLQLYGIAIGLSIVYMAFACLVGRRIPERYSHIQEHTLGFIPQKRLASLDDKDSLKLHSTPIAPSPLAWENDTEYRKRLLPTVAYFKQAINDRNFSRASPR